MPTTIIPSTFTTDRAYSAASVYRCPACLRHTTRTTTCAQCAYRDTMADIARQEAKRRDASGPSVSHNGGGPVEVGRYPFPYNSNLRPSRKRHSFRRKAHKSLGPEAVAAAKRRRK